ncbi:MAG: hypothetical protein A2Y24_07490 [Clostridiales bacterium GWE2_32_10]|nr:MAG: hypothetical protein A2Y24_07490 [Clostridiales bacterium GWE2_32_10]HBY20078.1 DUF1016 domain-containing protein [Clostridiales bacterium]
MWSVEYNIAEYKNLLNEIKTQISVSKYNALKSVNREMIILYYNIGKMILSNIEWGNKFIDKLAKDLKSDFPGVKGFSVRNLKYMRKFAEEYTDFEFVQQVVAQIPWGHNIILMDKVENIEYRKWYIHKAIENGWSRNILAHQIETNLYSRQAVSEKLNNFSELLPSIQSDLANETMKDPYVFDFISIKEEIKEAELEKQLINKITKFLLELGSGFAFIGNQYHLEVGDEDFYIDLLFYHTKLKCYVVIELKTGKFKPEYAGKLNFYLSVVDDKLKSKEDSPSIGMILCREKNRFIAEYSLKDMTKPIGISEYKLSKYIPKEYKDKLPKIEELEKEIADIIEEAE